MIENGKLFDVDDKYFEDRGSNFDPLDPLNIWGNSIPIAERNISNIYKRFNQ